MKLIPNRMKRWLFSLSFISCISLPCNAQVGLPKMPQVMQDKLDKVYTASIEDKEVTFILEEHQLFHVVREGACLEKGTLLLNNVLDAVCYNIDQTGNDELIVLLLAEDSAADEGHSEYGDALMIYELSLEGQEPKLNLKYTNLMGAVHPWKLAAGKLDRKDEYGNLFVGVYKDTRFYKEVINRPFFLTWQGEFIKRKWTGSYLSTREYVDLIFVDFNGDGIDEVAALEKKEDGTYIVSLYQWLTFGFEYLMSSKESYEQAELITCEPVQKEGESPIIWVLNRTGCEIVNFK